MPEVSFDTLAETHELEQAGCPTPQAEAIVRTVVRATSFNMKMVEQLAEFRAHVDANMATRTELAELSAHVRENMVTKAYLAEVLGQYDLKNMLTKTDLAELVDQYDLKNVVTKPYMNEELAAMREDIAALRLEVSQSFVQLYRHLLVGALGLAGVIIGFVKFL